jgi:hypothetical protein
MLALSCSDGALLLWGVCQGAAAMTGTVLLLTAMPVRALGQLGACLPAPLPAGAPPA